MDAERTRLAEDAQRVQRWKRWGPYLAERQWGTVREDYSEHGDCWNYFPHDHARSRAYRWGEDGLLGISDRQGRLCFALALWNGRDPILKERLFGLTGPEGNHGEDVKELYYYLDSTPTHSYMKALYRYPQAAFPYTQLVEENRRRGKADGELELVDTGVFDEDRYFDVFVEYAKADAEDVLVRVTVANRGAEAARLDVLPTLWFRNTWSCGRTGAEYAAKPSLGRSGAAVRAQHETLGTYELVAEPALGRAPALLFTENETNFERLYGVPNATPHVKDAFHRYVIDGQWDAVNPAETGTKAAFRYVLDIAAGAEVTLRLRLSRVAPDGAAPAARDGVREASGFDELFGQRIREADQFYAARELGATLEERTVLRQAYAGLLWSKQFYYYVAKEWLEGDPAYPPPPAARRHGRNHDWAHAHHRDVISMPDKWEYPWYAAWDLAFHMVAFAQVDPDFAKHQLLLFLREWYMHANGQIPAYEFALGDVNPPVHAWACWRVYKMTGAKGQRDRTFLKRAFHKLLLNFTWWVNRKDLDGHHLFAGGFLGLDNIGVFDRSQPLPTGGHLEQADGTAWMAFYCTSMLAMALELAREEPEYEDVASKFFEHFIAIADAMNTLGGSGLWDEQDGFYYDQLHVGGAVMPLRLRSLVGVVPLFACEILDERDLRDLPDFARRTQWVLQNRPDLTRGIACLRALGGAAHDRRLLAIPSRERLERILRYVLDETELLSSHGVRSLSQVYRDAPYALHTNDMEYRVDYVPAESNTGLFGGNSNWRGPVWFPLNYLLVEALERYHQFYGDTLRVEFPTGSGRMLNLLEVSRELAARLIGLFLPGPGGRRPCHGSDRRYAEDPHWRELLQFHEYFCGDTGRGVGASHQTGWTALVVRLIEDRARDRMHQLVPVEVHAAPAELAAQSAT
jgi:hypothetical protein